MTMRHSDFSNRSMNTFDFCIAYYDRHLNRFGKKLRSLLHHLHKFLQDTTWQMFSKIKFYTPKNYTQKPSPTHSKIIQRLYGKTNGILLPCNYFKLPLVKVHSELGFKLVSFQFLACFTMSLTCPNNQLQFIGYSISLV